MVIRVDWMGVFRNQCALKCAHQSVAKTCEPKLSTRAAPEVFTRGVARAAALQRRVDSDAVLQQHSGFADALCARVRSALRAYVRELDEEAEGRTRINQRCIPYEGGAQPASCDKKNDFNGEFPL